MIRDSEVLVVKVQDARSRDANNTTLHKGFLGRHVTVAGSNSPASFASRPIRICLANEIDRYPASAGSEGGTVALARKRSATFHNRRLCLTSTPTIKGSSRIETALEPSDQRTFLVPCPDCGEAHPLEWANVRWPDGRPRDAVYVCPSCGSSWDEAAEFLGAKKLSETLRVLVNIYLGETWEDQGEQTDDTSIADRR